MKEKEKPDKSKKSSFDWLVTGILTKIGDTFDRLTGRSYKPSSSLATSELIERLKVLLDTDVKESEDGGKFVPHNIKLKMQWDKFSADSEDAIQALENELHIAAIDHINDQRYYTYAPINIEIKPDYFTEGVKLLASFDKFVEDEVEVAVNVTVPELKIKGLTPPEEKIIEVDKEHFLISFSLKGKTVEKELAFELGERKSIGRTRENDLAIDDISISKIHAAFVLISQNQLMLADTGSSNGTFINGKRIAYGRAFAVNDGDLLKFGTVEVLLKHLSKEIDDLTLEEENFPEMIETKQLVSNENSSISEVFSNDDRFKNSKENQTVEKKPTAPNILIIEKEPEPKKMIEEFEFSGNKTNSTGQESDDEENVFPTKPGIVLDFSDK
jgi:pSer/pThr/pTyr-binding forkhead associated (FHA) protein